MLRKLALVGPPGSGKTTISEAWLRLDGLLARRLSFADRLKSEVAQAFSHKNRSATQIRNDLTHPQRKKPWRALLQAWGETRRAVDGEDYWVRSVEKYLEELEQEPSVTRVAIDDCRFPNEYEMLRRHGFVFVRLEPGLEAVNAISASEAQHESEKHWPDFDVDMVLSYEKGPKHQAFRIEEWLDELEMEAA